MTKNQKYLLYAVLALFTISLISLGTLKYIEDKTNHITPIKPSIKPNPTIVPIDLPTVVVKPKTIVVPEVKEPVKPVKTIVKTIPRSTNPRDTKHYIPPQAFQYFDIITKETKDIMPDLPYPQYIAGLIEHESCITLTHSKCWSPRSQLKTKRELGLGMLQITKAYRSDGSVRFDTLTELRNRYSKYLKELSWSTIVQRPDLQIRAGVLMTKNNFKALSPMSDPYQRLAASDAAYNGGLGSVRKRRRICGLKSNCDPQYWFGNLEHIVVKSTKPLYGSRSAQQINTEHVYKVLKETMPKYKPYFNS